MNDHPRMAVIFDDSVPGPADEQWQELLKILKREHDAGRVQITQRNNCPNPFYKLMMEEAMGEINLLDRKWLQAVKDEAQRMADVKGVVTSWHRTYQEIADACDVLDALIARSEIPVTHAASSTSDSK